MTEESDPVVIQENSIHKELKRAIGSGQINFLFGAGVNGTCFKNMSQFSRTIE